MAGRSRPRHGRSACEAERRQFRTGGGQAVGQLRRSFVAGNHCGFPGSEGAAECGGRAPAIAKDECRYPDGHGAGQGTRRFPTPHGYRSLPAGPADAGVAEDPRSLVGEVQKRAAYQQVVVRQLNRLGKSDTPGKERVDLNAIVTELAPNLPVLWDQSPAEFAPSTGNARYPCRSAGVESDAAQADCERAQCNARWRIGGNIDGDV